MPCGYIIETEKDRQIEIDCGNHHCDKCCRLILTCIDLKNIPSMVDIMQVHCYQESQAFLDDDSLYQNE